MSATGSPAQSERLLADQMSIADSNDLEDLDSVIEFSDAEEADEIPEDDIEQPLPLLPPPALVEPSTASVEPTEVEEGEGEDNIANSLLPHDDQDSMPDAGAQMTSESEAEVEASNHEEEPEPGRYDSEPPAKLSEHDA
ncbi:hypothetical protein FBU31_001637, partial [Coemansia sp. 'formosensis']